MEKLIEFLNARDQLLGIGNYHKVQNIPEAIARFRSCDNEEARFICQVYDESDFDNFHAHFHARLAYYAFGYISEEERVHPLFNVAHCYYAFLRWKNIAEMDEIFIAAEEGNALAQGFCAQHTEERFKYATKAAEQGDRYGLCELGCLYLFCGDYHEVDNMSKAIYNFKLAAQLGNAFGMYQYGRINFKYEDPEKYLWFEKSIRAEKEQEHQVCSRNCISDMISQVEIFLKQRQCKLGYLEKIVSSQVVYTIGRIFKNANLDKEKCLIFDKKIMQNWQLSIAVRAVSFYETWYKCARNATLCWLLVAKHLVSKSRALSKPFGLNKDISLFIARLVWEGKDRDFCD